MNLFAPKEFWELPEDQRNGRCGPGKGLGEKLVPDNLILLSITDCCSIHDYDFAVGETHEDFKKANRVFHNNMYRKIKQGSWWFRWARRRIADIYFKVVDGPLGAMTYWKNKNKPDELG